MTKRLFLNAILLVLVVMIYKTVFTDAKEIFFSAPERRKPALTKEERVNEIPAQIPSLDEKRNYFFPIRKIRRKKKEPENFYAAPVEKTDTLAVLNDGIKEKYLLRRGEKIWIGE